MILRTQNHILGSKNDNYSKYKLYKDRAYKENVLHESYLQFSKQP